MSNYSQFGNIYSYCSLPLPLVSLAFVGYTCRGVIFCLRWPQKWHGWLSSLWKNNFTWVDYELLTASSVYARLWVASRNKRKKREAFRNSAIITNRSLHTKQKIVWLDKRLSIVYYWWRVCNSKSCSDFMSNFAWFSFGVNLIKSLNKASFAKHKTNAENYENKTEFDWRLKL